MITPAQVFKCLSDETRLRCVSLVQKKGKLCVCELTSALALSQPKISRHLAQLRQYGLLLDSREGQWVYYRINPQLPAWVLPILLDALNGLKQPARWPAIWNVCRLSAMAHKRQPAGDGAANIEC